MEASSRRGLLWSLAAALVSGVSVYVNKYGVAQVPDPYLYTTLKNSLVAVALMGTLGARGWREVASFTPRKWTAWTALGLIGGGIPFLLFFRGLATAAAPSAALIHKTLFLWVALLAVPLLHERLGAWQIGGLAALAAGQLLLQRPVGWGWGSGETLILAATVLWAVETVVAKRVLSAVAARTAAVGRMGVGAVVMWFFLAASGRLPATAITATQWLWVALTSVFLATYVWAWYAALKWAPAILVTSVLTLGAVVTVLLDTAIGGRPITLPQGAAAAAMVLGVALLASRFPTPSARPARLP